MHARIRTGPLRELRRRLAPPHFQGTTSSGGDNFSEKIQSFDGRVTKGPERARYSAFTPSPDATRGCGEREEIMKKLTDVLERAGNRRSFLKSSMVAGAVGAFEGWSPRELR